MADDEGGSAKARELDPRVGDGPWQRAKRLLVYATGAIALGLAVAGSLDQRAGGVVLIAAWLVAIGALHRLGRAGSERRPP